MFDFFEIIAQFKAESKNAVLCIVVSSKGSTPRKPGSRMLVDATGWVVGSVGGGALEKKVISQAQDLLLHGGTTLTKHELVKEHAMCCGGQVEVYMECLQHSTPLYIFGAGHVGLALGKAAQAVNFQVYLADSRPAQLARAKKVQNSSNLGEHKNFHLIDLSEESFECAKAIEALQIPCTAYVCV
ncbi:MAG: xanthine dehydrogenase accessory factor, partial [Limisphaerales bacterium]